MSIKIIASEHPFDEEALARFDENQGLKLITVNHVITHEYVPWAAMSACKQEVVRWVYHFRKEEPAERGSE